MEEELGEVGQFGIGLADLLCGLLGFFFAMFILVNLLPRLEAKPTDSNQFGQLCVELDWPDDRRVDIDLWGKAPGDRDIAVGYTNPHSPHLDLFKDNLGWGVDHSEHNFENMCAGHANPGVYIFNASYFGRHDKEIHPDISLDVFMKVIYHKGTETKTLKGTWHLTHVGEEKTMISFTILENGDIDYGSVNSLNVKIRTRDPTPE